MRLIYLRWQAANADHRPVRDVGDVSNFIGYEHCND